MWRDLSAVGIVAGGGLHTGHRVVSNHNVYCPFGFPIATAVLLPSLNWFFLIQPMNSPFFFSGPRLFYWGGGKS